MIVLFAFSAERFAQMIVNGLAVGGAFLGGYFATGILTWFADRWLTGGKSRPGLYKATKNLGGVAAAVLAAFILFGHGSGWTMFGGGGDGTDNGTSNLQGTGGPGTTPTSVTDPTQKIDVKPPELPPEVGGRFERIRVTVLAGTDVREGRFFLVEEDRTPKTLSELESELKAKKQAAKKPIGVVPIYPPGSGTDTNGASLLFGLARREGFPIIPLDTPK